MDGALWGAAVPKAIPGRERVWGGAAGAGLLAQPSGKHHKPSAAPVLEVTAGCGVKGKANTADLRGKTLQGTPQLLLVPPQTAWHRAPLPPRPALVPEAMAGVLRVEADGAAQMLVPLHAQGHIEIVGWFSQEKSFPTSPGEPYTAREATSATPLRSAARPPAHPEQTLLPCPAPQIPGQKAPQVPKNP